MLKKVVVLTIVIALSLGVGLTALAADSVVAGPAFSDISGDPAEFELTVMCALGIMTGDIGVGGPVRPNATVTRCEYAKILVGALGYGGMANMMSGLQPTFKDGKDIPAWSWGFVNVAQQLGLIGGYPDGTFRAGNPVKYSEAVAMLVRCVFGHEQQVKKSMMPWPMNYIGYAVMWGFVGDVTPFGELPAIRGDIARMIFATMQVNRVTAEGLETQNSSLLKGRIVDGVLNTFTGTTAGIGVVDKPLAATYYLVGATSLAQCQYVEVRGILDKATNGKLVLIRKTGSSSSTSGLVFTNLDTSGPTSYLVFQGSNRVPYRTNVPTTLNNKAGLTQIDLDPGDQCQIIKGSDDYALNIVASRWDVGKDYIETMTPSAGATDTRVTLKNTAIYSIPAACQVQINGSNTSRDLLAQYDVIRMMTFGGEGTVPLRVDATRRTVEGTVANVTTAYPGPVYRVTINRASGGQGVYVLDLTYIGSAPGQGAYVKYGLDWDQNLYVPVALVAQTPNVLIKSTSTSGLNYSVTVDYRGAGQTYTSTIDLQTQIGQFGLLTISGTTGQVTAFSPQAILGTPLWQVTACSAASVTTLQIGSSPAVYDFKSNTQAYVYRYSTGAGTYTWIGVGGLSVGWNLTSDAARTFWVYTVP
jgi:hypothetical protein